MIPIPYGHIAVGWFFFFFFTRWDQQFYIRVMVVLEFSIS